MTPNRWFCNPEQRLAATDPSSLAVFLLMLAVSVFFARQAHAAHSAPDWMHAAAQRFQPHYDEKTDAVLLYSETDVTVVSQDKIRTHVREAYKILKPNGRHHGEFFVYTSGRNKITFMRGWCIPEHGQDYEVTDRDAIEQSQLAVPGYSLITDTRRKYLRIPAPDPGNVVGYEYEVEEQPFYLQDVWDFQESDPVLESHYRLTLPDGWQFKASWIKHSEIAPTKKDGNTWEWSISDMPGIRYEQQMPPYAGVAGKMVISFATLAHEHEYDEFATWNDMGRWYDGLIGERDAATAPIKAKVSSVTSGDNDTLAKMRDIAKFVQNEIRYVAVELGIGGFQPHAAPDVFSNRYGDCKDKATLTIAMMHAIGVEAYYVIINATRGAVNGDDPAHNGFNHAITAIRLPADVQDPSLSATIDHPKLGRLLFFDPTDEVTPFGRIRGELQSNYGLLVGPDGGELLQLPHQAPALSGIRRLARLTVTPDGTLQGQVQENRIGDRAVEERMRLRTATAESDKVKLLEALLSDSLGSFQITKTQFSNVSERDQPLAVMYAFQAPGLCPECRRYVAN